MAQLHAIGKPAHSEEARAIQFLAKSLPATYQVYSNLLLPAGGIASTYEYDAVVVAPHGIYAVEMKAYGGKIEGNRDHWLLADGKYVPSPIPLIDMKAKVLKGSLMSLGYDMKDIWVQGLVWVTLEDASPSITKDFAGFVKTNKNILKSLSDPATFGMTGNLTLAQSKKVRARLLDSQPRDLDKKITDYDLLAEIPRPDGTYRAFHAKFRLTNQTRILHVYSLTADSAKENEQRRIRALKEVSFHERLSAVPGIVKDHGSFQVEDPPRVVVVFEDTSALVTLGTWVKRFPKASLVKRLELALRIAHTLEAVHGEGIIHRRLSPDTILLDPLEEPSSFRLTTFDLGKDLVNRSATVTGSALQDPSLRCVAPEVFRRGETTVRSDLFSLGAVFFELFTGRALFKRAEDVVSPFVAGPLALDGSELPGLLRSTIEGLLHVEPLDRPATVAEAVEDLEDLFKKLTTKPPVFRTLEPGVTLRDVYELVKPIGSGATGMAWKARQTKTGEWVVVKVSAPEQLPSHDSEVLALTDLRSKKAVHPSLVGYIQAEELPDGRHFLVTAYVDGVTGREFIAAGDPLTPEQFQTLARGLYGALGTMHRAGWLHRDVKPENLVVDEKTLQPVLIDLSIACPIDAGKDLISGSIGYKDPGLWLEGIWKPAHDLYATAVVLWEFLSRRHPFGGDAASREREPDLRQGDIPETFSSEARAELLAFFRAAIHPEAASSRPKDAKTALEALLQCFESKKPSKSEQISLLAEELPATLKPTDPLSQIPNLSVSARVALHHLGCETLFDLAGMPATRVESTQSSRRVKDEIKALSALAHGRWPDAPPFQRRTPDLVSTQLFPALMGDERPLSDLGKFLTTALREHMTDLDVKTLGELAALPVPVIRDLRGIGAKKVENLRRELARLATPSAPPPASDEELLTRLKKDLTEREFEAISIMTGLIDGVPRNLAETASKMDLTRQRIDQLAADAVVKLRKPKSAGAHLMESAREAIGPVAFSSLEDLARGLELRFPSGASLLGLARLAAVLLDPARKATFLGNLTAAYLPPWKDGDVESLVGAVEKRISWPPVASQDLEELTDSLIPAAVKNRLTLNGVDSRQVFESLAKLLKNVERSTDDSFYRPPVDFAPGLDFLRGKAGLELGVPVETFEKSLSARLPGLTLPENPDRLAAELAHVGLAIRDGLVVDPILQPAPAAIEPPSLDASVTRQVFSLAEPKGPPIIEDLAASLTLGGFRVIALPPGQHHQLSKKLADWLTGRLSPGKVRLFDVDRFLIGQMKDQGIWEDVLFYEKKPDPSWEWVAEKLATALDSDLTKRRPGEVTILATPSLLGPLGLNSWVSGFYDAARGGKYGLVVLAVPGGVKNERVLLNNRYPIPCVPDMAPVYLETV